VQHFSDLKLAPELIRALTESGMDQPTEIQQQAIPVLLKDETDFVGLAKTGTGKTAAFGLPLLSLIDVKNPGIQAVILVPTRELGNQIFTNLETYAKYLTEISIASVCGGVPIKPQIARLAAGAHIVVATPGRLIDLIEKGNADITQARYLVLDEADEMLTALKDGFKEIIKVMPKNRRTWLFSATMPGPIKGIVNDYMSKQLTEVSVNMEHAGNSEIEHQYVVVDPIEKLDVLMHFLNSRQGQRGIIFCKTKAAVNKLAKNLAINRFSVGALHGSLAQPIRDRIMDQFRKGQVSILVASDLAARGIDVKEIEYVVNYHLPDVAEVYVHRSGRTARAGANGLSLTVIQQEEQVALAEMQVELGIFFDRIDKPAATNIEENNAIIWATKIFKTKPDHTLSPDFREKIHTIFHHLTKEELVDKMLAYQWMDAKPVVKSEDAAPKKKKKKPRNA
jgi:ATP-dependent RNA helicase DeaD